MRFSENNKNCSVVEIKLNFKSIILWHKTITSHL